MAESVESLFRRGMISPRAGKRAGVLKAVNGTKHERSKMADFEEKSGMRDQGGVRDRGDGLAGTDHINRKANTRAGSPIASKPSKGGQAGAEAQPGTDEINEGRNQRPDFPREGSRPKKQAMGTPKRSRGGVTQSGPQYGDPNSRRFG